MPWRRNVDEKYQDADDGEQGSRHTSTGLRNWGAFSHSAHRRFKLSRAIAWCHAMLQHLGNTIWRK